MKFWALVLALLPLPALAEPVDTVFELFTSQGCATCPAAEKIMQSYASRPEILILGFHVDYWDRLGWKDPYSSTFATARQYDYSNSFKRDKVYTPQLVVNGVKDMSGADEASVREGVLMKLPFQLEVQREGRLFKLNAEGMKPGRVYLAATGASSEMAVPRGENAGKKVDNINPIRHILYLGDFNGKEGQYELPAEFNIEGLKLSVMVQDGIGGPILAAAKI